MHGQHIRYIYKRSDRPHLVQRFSYSTGLPLIPISPLMSFAASVLFFCFFPFPFFLGHPDPAQPGTPSYFGLLIGTLTQCVGLRFPFITSEPFVSSSVPSVPSVGLRVPSEDARYWLVANGKSQTGYFFGPLSCFFLHSSVHFARHALSPALLGLLPVLVLLLLLHDSAHCAFMKLEPQKPYTPEAEVSLTARQDRARENDAPAASSHHRGFCC